jgi:hypothetical protein
MTFLDIPKMLVEKSFHLVSTVCRKVRYVKGKKYTFRTLRHEKM